MVKVRSSKRSNEVRRRLERARNSRCPVDRMSEFEHHWRLESSYPSSKGSLLVSLE